MYRSAMYIRLCVFPALSHLSIGLCCRERVGLCCRERMNICCRDTEWVYVAERVGLCCQENEPMLQRENKPILHRESESMPTLQKERLGL